MKFAPFDPLKHKQTAETEVAALAQRREIREILGSYVGWSDPFNELIQNSLDSVEARRKSTKSKYIPTINIIINILNILILLLK